MKKNSILTEFDPGFKYVMFSIYINVETSNSNDENNNTNTDAGFQK